MRAARAIFIILGVFSLISAGLGLLYNFGTLSAVWSGAFDEVRSELGEELPKVETAYYTMWAICTAFYLGLAFCGAQFLRYRHEIIWTFTGIMAAEVLFFIIVGRLWAHSPYAASISAATGIAAGGLMVQFLLLFPLWGPIAGLLARTFLLRHPEADEQNQL
jgi:hypothetical protein